MLKNRESSKRNELQGNRKYADSSSCELGERERERETETERDRQTDRERDREIN